MAQQEIIGIGEQAWLLRGFALSQAAGLLADVARIAERAPFRHMLTRNGPMSVSMTNCGRLGWTADRNGYRYTTCDPETGLPWPQMPESLRDVALRAASRCGFEDFDPDACLVNRYTPGSRMGMHRDQDEEDLSQPIVSVSLGLPAVFRWGGLARSDAATGWLLQHGDVVVWGGRSRMAFHGILALKAGHHPATGAARINLTFRRVRPVHEESPV